ncbi:MAG: hypothetical protein Ta2F_12130 [Termitinemataceae bacterium]|nr:MAG: hypothetical protein Ta2F_12130 [Termitinemataceae bacterium]
MKSVVNVRIAALLFMCICFLGCKKQKPEIWGALETPEQLNGVWEGGDKVLLPKGKFSLPVDTSGYVTAAVQFDAETGETGEITTAIKYDFTKLLSDAEKLAGSEGTKQDMWDNFKLTFEGDKNVVTDKFTVTTRSIIGAEEFFQNWEPEISQDNKKLRILLDLTNMYGTGRGTYFILNKVETSKILSSFEIVIF